MAIQFESSIEVAGSISVFGSAYVDSLFIDNQSGQISNRIWFDNGSSNTPGLYFEGGQPKFIIYSSVSNIFHDTYHPNADTWTTARTITIGNIGKFVNGSANVAWSLAEIGAVGGSGTTNYLARWTSADTLGIGTTYDNGTNVGIGTTTFTAPTYGTIPHLAVANVSGATLQLRNSTSTTLAGNTLGRIQFTSSYINSPFAAGNIRAIAANNASGGASGGAHILFETSTGSTGVSPSERMRITNTGNVGIGTTNPNTALEVDGSISTTTSDYVQGSTGSRLLLETSGSGNTHSYIQAQNAGGTSNNEDLALQLYGGNVGIGTASPQEKLAVDGSIRIPRTEEFYWTDGSINGNARAVIFSTDNEFGGDYNGIGFSVGANGRTAPSMYIRGTGNVGVGFINPAYKLDVNGTGRFTSYLSFNNQGYIRGDFSGELRLQGGTTATTFYNSSNSSELMRITQAGNVGIGTTNPGRLLEVKGGDNEAVLRLYNDQANTWDIQNSTLGKLDFIRGGSNTYMRIDQSGNVGIGTTNPATKLDVLGSAFISNNLRVGSTNTFKSCTYGAQVSLNVGVSNVLGGIANGIIGYQNTIDCTAEPWNYFGGNFIAGRNNTINNQYSHANAVFGQGNTVGDPTTSSNSVAGILVSGVGHSTFGDNSFAFGQSCFTDINADYSLTGGYDSNNFGGFGSVAIGAGATASAGNNQYAFGTGVTTPTTSSSAYGSDQFVVGKFNEYTNLAGRPHRFAVGNGASDFSRDTPFCIIGSGTYTNGQVSINDADGYQYTSVPYSIFHVNGRATSSYSSTFTTTSDERVKKNIVDYSKGLAEIIQVQPKSYAFNGKGNTIEDVESIGVLAQEIKDVFPETVGTVNKKLNPEDEQETELYTVDISPVTYALINAIKELNAKVEALEARIQTLEEN